MTTTLLRRTLLLAAALALTGCVTNQFKTTVPAANGVTIKNTKVYAYNFLDIRDAELGATMLDEVEKQFSQGLAASGVTLKVLKFKDSEVGKSFASVRGGMSIPIRRTVESNLEAERALPADYRLIIFPSNMLLQGAWRHYTIRWDLMDVKTSKVVWSSTSEGKHMVVVRSDETPAEKAKVIVDSAIAEMKANGLL
ncbi:MAG: hypothetical protein ABW190_01450 [Rhizobacter sp.]